MKVRFLILTKKNNLIIFLSILLFFIFIISIFLITNIKENEQIPISITVNNKKELNFEIDTNTFLSIKKSSYIIVKKPYLKDEDKETLLFIKEIKNIKNNVFNVRLSQNSNLKIVPNSLIYANLVLTKYKNFIEFII
ncbi:MAG1140 family protein [Mycoplasma sp. AC157]|uniref:MAG1140 family protein n=1 Tax=Mycoplasma sp. 480 TaxID=3440155 RepID=UPI003F514723